MRFGLVLRIGLLLVFLVFFLGFYLLACFCLLCCVVVECFWVFLVCRIDFGFYWILRVLFVLVEVVVFLWILFRLGFFDFLFFLLLFLCCKDSVRFKNFEEIAVIELNFPLFLPFCCRFQECESNYVYFLTVLSSLTSIKLSQLCYYWLKRLFFTISIYSDIDSHSKVKK